jgi:murein DD-endopeptidase MepM/ murein hydrolase activator NlpD
VAPIRLFLAFALAVLLFAPAGAAGVTDAGWARETAEHGFTLGMRPEGSAPYRWPVVGQVIREFEPPESPFGSGHRGIDIAVSLGTEVGAAATGVVSFAGWVAGSLFVSIDHPDGIRTTYSWLSEIRVSDGQPVEAGELVALTGHGHAEILVPHLHFGARMGDQYIDPLLLLGVGDLVGTIHLAPIPPGGDGASAHRTGTGGIRW